MERITVAEALAAGWVETDSTYERGYISRKRDVLDAVIHEAGGTRKGQYFYRRPSWRTTRFCVRQYIKPPQQAK